MAGNAVSDPPISISLFGSSPSGGGHDAGIGSNAFLDYLQLAGAGGKVWRGSQATRAHGKPMTNTLNVETAAAQTHAHTESKGSFGVDREGRRKGIREKAHLKLRSTGCK